MLFLPILVWLVVSNSVGLQKLQFLQEEKNKEIEALRQRVKELEQQSLRTFSESRLKRKKTWVDVTHTVACVASSISHVQHNVY